MTVPTRLQPSDIFVQRHIGPNPDEVSKMLATLGLASLEELVAETIPAAIHVEKSLDLGPPRGEHALLEDLRSLSQGNVVYRSFVGMGYYGTITPPVVQRNVLENPGWYTQYTPYQPEISQGRLEALLNFQTMVADLTGLPLANASLLDEATAAAEAMAMCFAISRKRSLGFFVAQDCHPQTINVIRTRARPIGVDVIVGDVSDIDFEAQDLCGVLVQYPATDGRINDYRDLAERAHAAGSVLVVATDLLALTLLRPPGEFGADIAIGSSQRFGVPMGYGGPHAAFMATRSEYVRKMPGRIVGISRDAEGNPGYRLSMQTREQHIRRAQATSNICTAQVLLAIMAGMYGAYHGPEGLKQIAGRVHGLSRILAKGLEAQGYALVPGPFFDTVKVLACADSEAIQAAARDHRMNLRVFDDGALGISLDETTELHHIGNLLEVFGMGREPVVSVADLAADIEYEVDPAFRRSSDFLNHEVFHRYHSEHEMLRYLNRLQSRDLSLTVSMIPLGSCTMKLNGTSEMIPITWPEFAYLHPFAPTEQARGYQTLFQQLERWLAEITGYAAISLQPNAGSQGEYAGLLSIRAYHAAQGQQRDVCLIPVSAHGTNPASAVMAGMRVVAVACDEQGNIDIDDLKVRAVEHADDLAALMITYPSTHGVFEEDVKEICQIVHEYGGQVYMDGANMNAQVGHCRPGDIGADVCHLNLHKTFCIPHGGGGPGMGPIGVASHLAPYLPGHPLEEVDPEQGVGPVSAAPYGSSAILPISWMYIALMGREGLERATEVAILNANYMAHRLQDHYDILYTGPNGRVAHEFVIDIRPYRSSANITVEDIAKRLMDYGFHAPTMSWPVAGTLMIEPTESETKGELDRFCDAMISIRNEIRSIEDGQADLENNVLKRAPHTAAVVTSDSWDRPYSRAEAAYPAPGLRQFKFWPAVGRVDNAFGDRNLICTCPSVEDLAS